MASKFELNDSTPAPPVGRINIVWQSDASGNVSGNIPEPSAGGAVASVFGRTGAVAAQAGDYTAAQVTGAVSVTGAYADPAWITSLDWTKINNKPSIPNQTPWTSHIDAAGFELRNAGKVGIGTAAPASKLSFGEAAPNITQRIALWEDSVSNAFRGIGMANPSASVYGVGIYALSSGIPTDTNMTIFVRDDNRVGIGTTLPSSKLSFGASAPNVTSRFALFENPSSANFRGIAMANPSGGVYGVGIYADVTPTESNMALFVRDGGRIAMQYLPSSNPGAGTKELYFDPADGNRVKYAV